MFLPIEFEAFFDWLCSHRDEEIVGLGGMCFHSPLARFLSLQAQATIGVDGSRYGLALVDASCWFELPRWASMFVSWSEHWFGRQVTAYEALAILAQVEREASPAALVCA